MVWDLESLYGDLTNMAFVMEHEEWMGFQQGQMPGTVYQTKCHPWEDQFVGSTSVDNGLWSS